MFGAGDANPGTYIAESDPLSNDPIIGTNGNDYLTGNDKNDSITGGLGSDTLLGGGGNDFLVGVSPTTTNPGKGEIDYLTGDAGYDTFALGNSSKAYYDDTVATNKGLADYGRIRDFVLGQDRIQLYSGKSYSLGASPSGLPTGTAIYTNSSGTLELIGVVEGVSSSTLLNNFNSAVSFV